MIHFRDEEVDVATATMIEEAKKFLSSGIGYVTEKSAIMLFRRPKRVSAYV